MSRRGGSRSRCVHGDVFPSRVSKTDRRPVARICSRGVGAALCAILTVVVAVVAVVAVAINSLRKLGVFVCGIRTKTPTHSYRHGILRWRSVGVHA